MRMTFSYEDLTTALALMTSVVSTKGVQDELKLGNLFIQNGEIKGVATSGTLVTMSTIDGEYDLEGVDETEASVAILLKEVNTILDKYKGLQRTKVASVELQIKEHCVIVVVNEEPKDEDAVNADAYRQATKFKVTKNEVKDFIKKEVNSLVISEDAVEMKGKELQVYLDYFYPPMNKPKDPVTLQFKPDYVCAVMGHIFAVLMKNTLPKPLFQDMSFSNTVVGFLRNLIPTAETFKIHKNELPKDEYGRSKGIILTLEIGKTLIVIKTNDTTGSVNIAPFVDVPVNRVKLDKLYLMDTLKRVDPMEPAYLTVEIENGVGTMQLNTLRATQEIPVTSASGSGKYNFTILPDHLSQLIFSHVTKSEDGDMNMEDVEICLQMGADNRVVQLTCKDSTDLWSTKYPRAQVMDAPKIDW